MTRSRCSRRSASGPALFTALFLFERVDQIDRGEEPDFLAVMLDCMDIERGRYVRLASSRAAYSHVIVTTLDEVAAMQLPDQCFLHFAGCEVKAYQVFIGRGPGGLDLASVLANLARPSMQWSQHG